MSMKNSSDTIGNRTRDLPACSAVPQPTALPRAPIYIYIYILKPAQELRLILFLCYDFLADIIRARFLSPPTGLQALWVTPCLLYINCNYSSCYGHFWSRSLFVASKLPNPASPLLCKSSQTLFVCNPEVYSHWQYEFLLPVRTDVRFQATRLK